MLFAVKLHQLDSDCRLLINIKLTSVGGRSVVSGRRARIGTLVGRCDTFYLQANDIILTPVILYYFLRKESVPITIRNRISLEFPLNCRIRWTLILISNRSWFS